MLDTVSYSDLMENSDAYISIELDLVEPVEISDFAALFAGFAADFEDYLKENNPDLTGRARMYVREVRKGSIVADLFANIKDMIGIMDASLIVLTFAAIFNRRIRDFVQGKRSGGSRAKLTNAIRSLRALANDPAGKMTLRGFRWRDSVWDQEFEAVFDADEARQAIRTIEGEIAEVHQIEHSDHQRVLMVFTRSDIRDVKVGKRTGERVKIEELSDRPLALMYGSDLAESRIKHEIRESDENVFKKGFVVDVNVKTSNGRSAAYSVVNVHDVIDLPDVSADVKLTRVADVELTHL